MSRDNGYVYRFVFCVLILVATSCASSDSVSSKEFDELKADVEQISADVKAITHVAESTKQGYGWPEDYQNSWRDICAVILKDAAEADPTARPPQEICGCVLKGLMGAFTLKDYESWPQGTKDGAAAPYTTMCWAR